MRASDPDEAEAFLQAALVEEPAVAKHHCMLGELAVGRGDENAAIASFERALELAPWRADCRLGLIEDRKARGQRKAVAQALDAAPEPAPELSSFRARHGYAQ